MSVSFHPIDDSNIGAAVALLEEGFPYHRAGFWRHVLSSIADYARSHQIGSLGTLMNAGDQAVGVLLTLPARQADGRRVVNLSSWYVRQKYRWLAPRMLQQATSDPSTLYTDLTATHDAAKLNRALGFQTVTSGMAFFALPLTAARLSPKVRIVPFGEASGAVLSADQRDMLRFHQDLGCICGVMREDSGHSPVIFNRARWRRMPCARLIHARQGSIKPVLGAIARFLLRSGMLTMTVPTNDDGELPIRKDAPVMVKGDWQGERVDAAYSELAFLHL